MGEKIAHSSRMGNCGSVEIGNSAVEAEKGNLLTSFGHNLFGC